MPREMEATRRSCADGNYRVHKLKDIFFLRFWLIGLPTTWRCPDNYFSPRLAELWSYSREAIRLASPQGKAVTHCHLEVDRALGIFNGR